jgi:hypothetical protein
VGYANGHDEVGTEVKEMSRQVGAWKASERCVCQHRCPEEHQAPVIRGTLSPEDCECNGYTETCHTDQANAFKSKWSWFSERGPEAHDEHQQSIGGTGPAKQPVQTQAAPTHHCGLRDEDDHPRIEHGTMDAKECHEPMWALGMEQAIAHRSAEAIGDQRQHQQRHGEVEHAGLAGALPPVARRAVSLGHVKHPIAP